MYRLRFLRSRCRRLRSFVIKFFFLDVVRDVEIPRGFGKGQLDIDHFRENARSTLDLRTREIISLREAQYRYLTGCCQICSWPGIHLILLSSPEPSFVPLGGWGEAKTRRVSDDGRKKKEQSPPLTRFLLSSNGPLRAHILQLILRVQETKYL